MDTRGLERQIETVGYTLKDAGKGLWVIEYELQDGWWTLRDSFIRGFFENLAHKDRIFYNVADTTFIDPVRFFRNTRLFVGFDENFSAVGGYWITAYNYPNRSGTFNCGVTKEYAGNTLAAIRFARQGLAYLLDHCDINTLYGDVSERNTAVLVLAKFLGFEQVGRVPGAHFHADTGEFCDAIIMYVNHNLLKRG